jgi:hypothetical protein
MDDVDETEHLEGMTTSSNSQIPILQAQFPRHELHVIVSKFTQSDARNAEYGPIILIHQDTLDNLLILAIAASLHMAHPGSSGYLWLGHHGNAYRSLKRSYHHHPIVPSNGNSAPGDPVTGSSEHSIRHPTSLSTSSIRSA